MSEGYFYDDTFYRHRSKRRHVSFFPFILFAVLLFLPGIVDARRMCHTFLGCAPLLLEAPLREIVDASKFYAKSFLVVSEISDEEWEKQMRLVENLCETWISFDTCMERNWLECIDWNQMLSFLDVMAKGVEKVGVQGAQIDKEAANYARDRFIQNNWTAMTFRDAMDIATYSCRNIRRFTPYMKCARDVLMANETILNVTLRWRALAEAKCFDGTRYDCNKTQAMMTALGHWMYHGCREFSEELTELVQMMFTTVFGQQLQLCSHLVVNKTAKELFEKAPPPEIYYNFGDDLRNCNMTAVDIHNRWTYDGSVTDYLDAHNMTKAKFFEMMQHRLKKSAAGFDGSVSKISLTSEILPKFDQTEPLTVKTEILETSSTKRATARYGKRRRRTTTPTNEDYGFDKLSSSTAAPSILSTMHFINAISPTILLLLIQSARIR